MVIVINTKPNMSMRGVKNPASKPTPIPLRAPPSFTKAKTLPLMVNKNPPNNKIDGLKFEPNAVSTIIMSGKIPPIRRPISVSISSELLALIKI